MKNVITAFLFCCFLFSRCPCCGRFTRFSKPEPALTGHIPVELQGIVPQICKCRKNGCTSSVRAITTLELRKVTTEA